MSNSVKTILLAAGGVALALILAGGGFLLGRSGTAEYRFPAAMDFRESWMTPGDRWGMPGGFPGMGQRGWGSGERYFGESSAVEPLALEEAEDILHEWLEDLDQDDLVLGEVMIFDNHAYAQIVEESTGIGAMEVLVDPATGEVYPERGPNMMWNQKYSPMGSMHGRRWPETTGDGIGTGEEMTVSLAEAVEAAQEYLNEYYPDREADDHGEAFYGYYTLHVIEDDQVVGMLSVNGYTGQVFYHTWHGKLLEMSEH